MEPVAKFAKLLRPGLISNENRSIIYYASAVHTAVQFLSRLEVAFHMCSGMHLPGFDPDTGTSQAVPISAFYLTTLLKLIFLLCPCTRFSLMSPNSLRAQGWDSFRKKKTQTQNMHNQYILILNNSSSIHRV